MLAAGVGRGSLGFAQGGTCRQPTCHIVGTATPNGRLGASKGALPC
ncbi:hypothetical protein JI435_403070 [Parastagonospora nodorum SN15]|uniref:Uncharacterized protein n=1 Tax=Phaeosphaeria nodorum (strain SN15 / ATCC MYA-4574 / FGSC 10173) TaxID=321614 RepID=A0A7U2ETT1_PHANO|nr:hypothetical protein JI435_403070 [Parastagonospora nodorum SN15]